jgi:hypothetical protein
MKAFLVTRLADQWAIEVDGRLWGRFLYRVDAEEAALRLAAREGGAGEVLVQGAQGKLTRLKVA